MILQDWQQHIISAVYPVGTFDLGAKEAAEAAEAAAEEAAEAEANGQTVAEDENATEYVDPSIGLATKQISLIPYAVLRHVASMIAPSRLLDHLRFNHSTGSQCL